MVDFPLLRQDNLDMFYDDGAYSQNENIGYESFGASPDTVNIRLVNELLEMHSIQRENVNYWVNYEYFNDNTSNFYPNSGYPILRYFFHKGDSGFMEENNSNSEKELQQKKWEDNFKRIMEANQNSKRTIFTNDDDMIEFIHNCEKFYHKTTEEHLMEHQQRGFEGNVDERRWYRFAKYLLEKGISF